MKCNDVTMSVQITAPNFRLHTCINLTKPANNLFNLLNQQMNSLTPKSIMVYMYLLFQPTPAPLAVGRRKLAVVAMGFGSFGMSLFPRAILTIAVMWVSGPNTWIGTPKVLPGKQENITLSITRTNYDTTMKKQYCICSNSLVLMTVSIYRIILDSHLGKYLLLYTDLYLHP